MTAVAFDTMKLARRLESVGFTHDQADGAAAALAEAFSAGSAIKSDSSTLDGTFGKLGSDLRGDIAALRSSTAHWIFIWMIVNMLTNIGAVAAVWQIARR